MKKGRSKIENLIKQEVDPEVRRVISLRPIEVSKRITQLLNQHPAFIKQVAQDTQRNISLDVLLARVIMHGMTAQRPSEAVACIEWLMQRTIGKAEGVISQGQINQGDRKITYITTIEGDGTINNETIESDFDE